MNWPYASDASGSDVFKRGPLAQKGVLECPILAQSLVQHDADRVAQVEASHRPEGRDGPDVLPVLEEYGGQSDRLQGVPGFECRLEVRSRSPGGKQMNSPLWLGFFECLKRFVSVNLHQVSVVEARAAHRVLVDSEAERSHQVQGRSGGSAGPGDRSGVGWDLRLDQDHVKRVGHRVGAELRPLGHACSYDRG